MNISCGESDPQLSSIAQVCTKCLPPLPTVENLQLGLSTKPVCSELYWKYDVDDDRWLVLLRPFTAVKILYLSEEFQPNMAFALQELVGDRATEVLHSLQNIFLAGFEPSGPFQEAIRQFVAARQGSIVLLLPSCPCPRFSSFLQFGAIDKCFPYSSINYSLCV